MRSCQNQRHSTGTAALKPRPHARFPWTHRVALTCVQGYHGGYANGIAAVRPAAKPKSGGGSKLKKLTGGPAKGRAGAKASAARLPAKPRPLKQELGALG